MNLKQTFEHQRHSGAETPMRFCFYSVFSVSLW